MSNLVILAIGRLQRSRVTLANGLSDEEFTRIEETFGFTFGPEHRELLAAALPTGDRWPDWRHGSRDKLQEQLSWPVEGVLFDVHNNSFWPSSWGERPSGRGDAERLARERLADVPRLVPIYSHRYLTADRAFVPSPVFSVYQTDVIYYGDNLLDYVAHEFNAPPQHPAKSRPHVPFWSDLAEGLEVADL